MQGKTVVITGATSGIGAAAALALAGAGARVVFTARSSEKGEASLAALRRAGPQADHGMVVADLTTIAAMKAAAAALADLAPRIDVLANNAGAIFDRHELTADGLEQTFAVNHMAYFVVTETLRPHLAEGSRIVSTASTVHSMARIDFDNLQFRHGYSTLGAYGLSKLCNILWTRELARRLEGTGVTANCLHPGGVNTGFGDNMSGLMRAIMALGKPLMLTPEQGADTLVWLASAPEVAGRTGGYYARRKLTQPSAAARDSAAGARLWAISAELAGLPA